MIMSLLQRIDRQMSIALASMMSIYLKYMALKNFRDEGVRECNHSPYLFSKQGFVKSDEVSKSQAPSSLGLGEGFLAFPVNLSIVFLALHQNLALIDSISPQIVVGIRKQDIT